MKHTKHLTHILAFFFGVLTIVITAPDSTQSIQYSYRIHPVARSIATPLAFVALDSDRNHPDTPTYRIAERLRKRLRSTGRHSPSLSQLEQLIARRQDLLGNSVNIVLEKKDGNEYAEWNVSVQRYPTLLSTSISLASADVSVSEENVTQTIAADLLPRIAPPVDAEWVTTSTGSVPRVQTDTIAMTGYELYMVNGEERDLVLLATGKSNYRGSTYARMANVHKALTEYVHNVLIEPGEEFSFNAALDPPVTQSKGWRMAKVIYNGDELRPSPGGGICQASTTTYRAVVHAGLPVVERRSHSLFVSYYKHYGVGIDATVYPGSQDLVFKNDTPGPIILQSYDDENYDAYVHVYGVSDGRTVELEGPFFASSAPEIIQVNERSMRSNEIVWLQRIQKPGENVTTNMIVSRYQTLPLSLPLEFAEKEVEELAHSGL